MYDMDKITVSKDDLLVKLQENRDKHRTVFLDAWTGYSEEAQRILNDHLMMIRNGQVPRKIQIILAPPEDHTRDYDRVIGMLKMHQGDTFDLDEQMYAQYVDDDWSWKRAWLETSTQYAAASVAKNYQVG